jgi:hypothetical protein
MSEKTEAEEYLELLKYSLEQQKSSLNRLMSLQDSYDNKINSTIWPTQSEIPTAQHFVAVEEALGPAMDMCFPESSGLQLVPDDTSVDGEQWRRAEWGLWTMVQHRMRIRDAALRSVKDCFKCSVGYGKVEPITITPTTSGRVVTGGTSTKIMMTGAPQTTLQYRYISAGKIVPYPSGTDFNGRDATPISFHFDPYPLWQIEEMYKEGYGGVAASEMKATLSEVREAAAKFSKSGATDFTMFLEKMGGGRKSSRRRDNLPDAAPTDVPVIKVFVQPGTEIWIVPEDLKKGVVFLKRESDGLTIVRNDLVKWDAWPDSDRWFPMSQPEADQKRAFAYDLWLNFFFDIMGRAKDTPRVIDKSALPHGQDRLLPYEDIYIEKGSAREAASYLDPPRVDPSIPAMGDILDRLGQKIQGKHDFTQKNFTRGGTMAFNDLLNSMQGRQRLTSSILETGALARIYEHVLAHMQQIVPEGGFDLQRPVYDADEGETILQQKTVTPEDLRHGYSIVLDTAERRMLGGMSDESRFRYWGALVDRDDVRKDEVNRTFPYPDATLRRVFKSKKEQEEQQAVDREVGLLGSLQGGGGGAQPTQEAGGINATTAGGV